MAATASMASPPSSTSSGYVTESGVSADPSHVVLDSIPSTYVPNVVVVINSTRAANKNSAVVKPVVNPVAGGLQHDGLYDDTLGFPFKAGLSQSVEYRANLVEYDFFFGPPVRAGDRHKKPHGAPKASGSITTAQSAQLQQRHAVQMAQRQQQQQQHEQQVSASPVSPSAAPASANPSDTDSAALAAFGQCLGVATLEKEPHLAPLLQQMLAAPVPAPWTAVRDPTTGRTYYGNAQTRATSWDHPLKPQFVEAIAQARKEHINQSASPPPSFSSSSFLPSSGVPTSPGKSDGPARAMSTSVTNSQPQVPMPAIEPITSPQKQRQFSIAAGATTAQPNPLSGKSAPAYNNNNTGNEQPLRHESGMTAAAAAAAAAVSSTTPQQQQPLRREPGATQPQQQGHEVAGPNNAALAAFGQCLGVATLEKEPHLAPLLQQMLAAPVPAPWTAVRDPTTGRTYYGNAQTRATSWDHPLKPQFVEAIAQARKEQHSSRRAVGAAAEESQHGPLPGRNYTPPARE